MVVRPLQPLVVLALAATLLAGCLADNDPALGGIPEGSQPTGQGAGSPSDHGTPDRTEGSVQVTQENGRWVARKTITYTNDFGGAAKADVKLSTDAGGVSARPWTSGGYKVAIGLQSRADTESAARAGLSKFDVSHSDHLGGGTLELSTRVDIPSPNNGLTASITANVPKQPSYTLDLEAGSGGAVATGLSGPSVVADTGSGGISIDGAFGLMRAHTGSGGVELVGTANEVDAETGSGGVAARLGAGASGTWTFEAGSGGVEVDLDRSAGDAFDVEAEIGSGGLSVQLSDGEPVGSQTSTHKHVRSTGFSDAGIQVHVVASTGSGGTVVSD